MTTTTKLFRIEYYDDDQCEESDPDPVFTHESDNTEDLFVALATELSHVQEIEDATYIYLDMIDNNLRYAVYDHNTKTNVGVAIIVYP